MKRHELIRQQYRLRRYMEHLSIQELEQRAKDIFLNQLVLSEEKNIGLHPLEQEGEYWITIWTHLLEEFNLRYGPYPSGFTNGFIKDVRIPSPSLDMARKACEVVKRLKLQPDKYLFKFSKYDWLEQIYKKGLIRISPASSYADSSLNSAIQDDELKRVISNTKGIKIVQESVSDYFVYCMSSAFTPRLFLDFDADSCLIIKKPHEFISRVLQALEKDCQGWNGVAKIVKYFDPHNVSFDQVDIYSFKHFRYSYQKEFRLIWLPTDSVQNIDHQFIEIGSLENCCELICIG